MIKLDLVKAFDKVSWDFLKRVMQAFRFPQIWIDWSRELISNPIYSVQVNGCNSEWFGTHSGIRQGCPLSPYLFILCAEVLSRLIRKECRAGDLLPLKLAPAEPRLSHFLFADDVAVFATLPNCLVVKEVLCKLSRLSDQEINPAKCKIVVR